MKRYGLSAPERIKGRKDFERIFVEGKTIYSAESKIRVNYVKSTASEKNKINVFFAIAVAKKLGGATWRNKVKRLIREAYRLNKLELIEECTKKNVLLEIIFSPQNINQTKNSYLGFDHIAPSIKELIAKLKEKI